MYQPTEAFTAILLFRSAPTQNFVEDVEICAFCQVSFSFIQRFQRRSRTCFSQSGAWAAILVFLSARRTQIWQILLRSCFLSSLVEFLSAVVEKSNMSQQIRDPAAIFIIRLSPKSPNFVNDVRILHLFQFSLNSVQRFQWRRFKCLSQSEACTTIFSDRPQNTNLDLASCQVSFNSIRWFQKRSRTCLSNEGSGGHFVFPIGLKNTNLVEDVGILLLVKCH